MIGLLCYVADAAIIITYFVLARSGNPRPFHWANAIGAIPLIVAEVALGAWPVLILTSFFGFGAIYGLMKGKR